MTLFIPEKEEDKLQQRIQEKAPWAIMLEEVDGGYMAFETYDDFKTWKAQV
jgi:hypothetical protein